MSMRGKYVLFEGISSSGKSTLAASLANALRNRYTNDVAELRFPDRASPIGKILRDSFEGNIPPFDPKAILWLFMAEQVDTERENIRYRDVDSWIICDRHVLISARVFQVAEHSPSVVESTLAAGHFIAPDRIYIVDVPAQLALERRLARGAQGQGFSQYAPVDISKIEIQRQAYLGLREQFHTVAVLDGTRSVEDNIELIWTDLGLPRNLS